MQPLSCEKYIMKILFLTGHSFHPDSRKASIHFLASGLKDLGHDIYVLTVGSSILRVATAPHRSKGALLYRTWKLDKDGIRKRVHINLIHRPAKNWGILGSILDFLSSRNLPSYTLREAGEFDAVILDSGLAVNYYDYIRKKYSSAFILYNAADSLAGVGYSQRIIHKETDVLIKADSVRSPSALLAKQFPSKSRIAVIPHGVDKSALLTDHPSPYPSGSKNAVLVGSTLLDWEALIAIAQAAPDTKFHVFGVADRSVPSNIILHGEVSFNHLVPFMQHASYALAPYKLTEQSAYIAESSLKIRQYRVCGLAIVCPSNLAIAGSDVFHYDPSNLSMMAETLEKAVAYGKQPFQGSLPSWKEVAEDIEKILTRKIKITSQEY